MMVLVADTNLQATLSASLLDLQAVRYKDHSTVTSSGLQLHQLSVPPLRNPGSAPVHYTEKSSSKHSYILPRLLVSLCTLINDHL